MTSCRISEIKFNDGSTLSVDKDDIVVFVGPNNAGKSRAITDIYNSFISNGQNIVIDDIAFHLDGIESLRDFVEKHSREQISGTQTFHVGYGFSIFDGYLTHPIIDDHFSVDDIRNFFVSRLETRSRLSQSDPVDTIDKDDPPTHPLHYVAANDEYLRKLSDAFCKAFDRDLIIEKWSTKRNYLRIGTPPPIETTDHTYEEAMKRYEKITSTFPKVHEQGDGIKGFIGVLLNLMMENFSIFLMDEPEAFLHHPQAKIIGNEIPALLGDRQAFISTHSEALVRGLLERASKRVKIIRITREDNHNRFSILDNRKLSEVWNDSLLKHSNVMESLFYKNVVVCESDSDCMFYSIILTVLKEEQHRFPETLFVYSSTKSRLKIICRLLKALDIDFRVIPDIDVLREHRDIRELVEACGGVWDDDTAKKFTELSNHFKDDHCVATKDDLVKTFADLIDRRGGGPVDAHMLSCIKGDLKLDDKWKQAKSRGRDGLPSERAKELFDGLTAKFREYNVHIVEDGELESFIDDVGARYHGPKWVDRVLTVHPDLFDPAYDRVKKFIGSLNL